MGNLRFAVGSGRLAAEVSVEDSGDGLVVTVFGGERPHVGTVVLAQPRPSRSRPGERSATSSCLSLLGHQDEALARPVAEALARALGVPVVVVAGVHLEGIQPEEIAAAMVLGPRIAEEVLRRRVSD
ncbi:MAG TPA: hypothetical protein GXX28_03715 [Firmicutes bacterium]|nr:hypothetical protein [Bacillota bacterium]